MASGDVGLVPAGDAHPDDRAGRAVDLLRRRDRPARRAGPGLPPLLPVGPTRTRGTATSWPTSRAPPRSATRTRSCAAARSGSLGGRGAWRWPTCAADDAATIDRGGQRRRPSRPGSIVELPELAAAMRSSRWRSAGLPRPGPRSPWPTGGPRSRSRPAPGASCSWRRDDDRWPIPRRSVVRPAAGPPPHVAAVALAGRHRRAGWPRAGRPRRPPPSPSAPPVAVADLPPLAPDGAIDEAGLAHDSRSDRYRTPFGAVPAGTTVTLRLRATAGDLTEATVRVWDQLEELQALIPMQVVASDRTAGRARLRLLAGDAPDAPPGRRSSGTASSSATARPPGYVEDDPPADGGAVERGQRRRGRARLRGQHRRVVADRRLRAGLHDAGLGPGRARLPGLPRPLQRRRPVEQPVARTRSRGPTARASTATATSTATPSSPKAWDELPEGYCRAYQGVTCDETPARPRLLRRRPGGDHREARRPRGPRRDRPLPQPDLRGALQPPLRHQQLRRRSTPTSARRPTSTASSRRRRRAGSGSSSTASSTTSRPTRRGSTGRGASPRSAPARRPTPPYRSWFTFRAPKPNEPVALRCLDGGRRRHLLRRLVRLRHDPRGGRAGRRLRPRSPGRTASSGAGSRRGRPAGGSTSWTTSATASCARSAPPRRRPIPDALVLGEQWLDASAWLLGRPGRHAR